MGTQPHPLEGIAVLVVDDDPDARYLLQRLLGHLGAFVMTAASVPDALSVLGRVRPDVVVTDILMPHHDGIELMREIAQGPHDGLPVIALTAFSDVMGDEIAEAGFSAVLQKPTDMWVLAGTIVRLVMKRGR